MATSSSTNPTATSGSAQPSFTKKRRWRISFTVILSIAAVLVITAEVNYLATRYFGRYVWTTNPSYQISPLTRQVLDQLTNDVQVVVYYNRGGVMSEGESALYSSVSSLINEYDHLSPNIHVQYIDPLLHLTEAEKVRKEYHLPMDTDKNMVIFDCNEQTKIVYEKQLSDYDWEGLMKGKKEIKRTNFKGELLFTSAIVSVTEAEQAHAYFAVGHRELDPQSDHPQSGCLKLANVLKQNNIRVHTINLMHETPPDEALLILAGPRDPFTEEELRKIDQFLEQGGRALALLSPVVLLSGQPTGLENVLGRWGVKVGHDYVEDPQNLVKSSQLMVVTNFTEHPIVKPLAERLYLAAPRSVQSAGENRQQADGADVTELARTSPAGRVVDHLTREGHFRRTPGDRRGEIPMIVAVEKGSLQGVQDDRGSTRIVVAGESRFLGNQLLEYSPANHDFAVFAVNWLLDRSYLLGELGPRPIREYKIVMTDTQMERIRWILLAGLPGGIFLLGLMVWFSRRH